jgi:hypothetical protein
MKKRFRLEALTLDPNGQTNEPEKQNKKGRPRRSFGRQKFT